MPKNLSRRSLLKALSLGLGIDALSSLDMPWIPQQYRSLAYAQNQMGAQKRLLLFFTPNGAVANRFYPTGSERNFQISPQSVLAPLDEIKNDLVIIEGLNFLTGNNHEGGMGAMLTNGHHADSVTGGQSIDQYLAQNLNRSQAFPSLELGVLTDPWGASIQTRMCYQSPDQFVHPDSDPRSVFRRLFGSSEVDEEQANRERGYRRSVLDLVMNELSGLKLKVGGEPYRKLDQHLTSVREIETRLNRLDEVTCETPQVPPRLGHLNHQLLPELLEAQMDLAMLAFSCDLTSILTLQVSHTVSPVTFSWVGNTSSHHSLSHAGDGTADLDQFITAEQWCATQFKQLIQRLKGTPDPVNGGSLFDHTVTVWVKELGDSRLHTCESVPFVIAGSGGGSWETGRFLQNSGVSHSHLLVSLCNAMGLNNQSFGDPTTGMGPLAGLSI
jgi:hypothetical protein